MMEDCCLVTLLRTVRTVRTLTKQLYNNSYETVT